MHSQYTKQRKEGKSFGFLVHMLWRVFTKIFMLKTKYGLSVVIPYTVARLSIFPLDGRLVTHFLQKEVPLEIDWLIDQFCQALLHLKVINSTP